MSREQYQVPTVSPTYGTGSGFAAGGPAPFDVKEVGVGYQCGECGVTVTLRRSDPVRCDMCGHRILYKERTKRMVQFEAR